ncbi:helix-turn-helix transcriptional regulator [Streptomyces sp. HNM0575]|uniref:winged helix-turn-helix transcriptional regulator n=1 Tax=Streptomyces sp. HNM0575 TaxID=2716338 RepID=UPI00145E093D|nr:helix-turn-helix domain-containing protein [Streptomyces sp. HNM0575]NLU76132.1 helix-turn-helix transcriptional regulator [Streptomyces sp. HNM0575]
MARREVDPRECSLASALNVVGEKWSLLAVREVFYGVHRFDGIVRNTGAPRDVLAARLRTLVDGGVLRRVRYSERPPRDEYRLTRAGRELAPALLGLMRWGMRWVPDAPVGPTPFTHDCGGQLDAGIVCASCGEPVGVADAAGPDNGTAEAGS